MTLRYPVYSAGHVSAPGNGIGLLDLKNLAFSQDGFSERFVVLAQPANTAKYALAALDLASGKFHS